MEISNVIEKLGRAIFEAPFGGGRISKDAPELAVNADTGGAFAAKLDASLGEEAPASEVDGVMGGWLCWQRGEAKMQRLRSLFLLPW